MKLFCKIGLILALLICSMLFVLPLYAELPTDRPLTLKECIDYALANHSSVLTAQRNLISSSAAVTSARAGFIPQITASSMYSDSGVEPSLPSGVSGRSLQHTIGVTEYLVDGWRTPTALKQALAAEKMALADLEQVRQERVLAVTTAYFEALRTKRLADIAQQTLDEAQQQRDLVQARIDAGDAAQVDIYPVEVQLANAKLAKIKADNNARLAADTLRNVIGLGRGPALMLVEADGAKLPSDIPSLDEYVAESLKNRPEIVSYEAQIDSQKAALSYAKLQRMPVPTVSMSYKRGYGDAAFDSNWEVGVGLSLSIFDGGALAADVRSAKAKLESIQLMYDQKKKDIVNEVEQAYLNYKSSLEQLEASKTNVLLAQKNVEVAREKYSQGLGIAIEITTAEVAYSEALANNAQALYDSYVAFAQLEKAVGRRNY